MTEGTMLESNGGVGSMTILGMVIFVIIILAVFFRGGGLFGGASNGNGNAYSPDVATAHLAAGGCTSVPNCEVQKQEIIDTMQIKQLIEKSNHDSTDQIKEVMQGKWHEGDLNKIRELQVEKLASDNKYTQEIIAKNAKIDQLTLAAALEAKFNSLQAQIASVSCNMLTKPNVTGVGAVCPNAGIINGLGYTGNNSCNC